VSPDCAAVSETAVVVAAVVALVALVAVLVELADGEPQPVAGTSRTASAKRMIKGFIAFFIWFLQYDKN